jgi:capsular exopolysaccharide synthesis family protein
LAANLAIVFAQLGQRTLLMDANFRTPVQHELFGVHASAGLSAVLTDRCTLGEAILPIEPFENLAVICTGAMPPNPQELLSRARFREVIDTLPEFFDVIIVDTPSVLEYADAQITVAAAGGCLLATRRNRTRLADVERAKAKLVPTRAVLLGAAITG